MALRTTVLGSIVVQAFAASFIDQNGSTDLMTYAAPAPLYAAADDSIQCWVSNLAVNETLHGFAEMDIWMYSFKGDGMFHTNNPAMPNVAAPVGSHVFVAAGTMYAFFLPPGTTSAALLACMMTDGTPTVSAGFGGYIAPSEDPLPVLFPAAPYARTFYDINASSSFDLLGFPAPLLGEGAVAHPLVLSSPAGATSIFAVVLATAQTYQHHDHNSLVVLNVQGQHVQASAAADELALIDVPEGSAMVLKPGENYKFMNNDAESPAELVFVFNPVLHPGDTHMADGAGKMACSTLKKHYRGQQCCNRPR